MTEHTVGRWPGAGSRGPLRPSREPGRRLVDVELSKEDVRKERRSAKAMPTCEKRRSTVAELVAAGQPQGIDGLLSAVVLLTLKKIRFCSLSVVHDFCCCSVVIV